MAKIITKREPFRQVSGSFKYIVEVRADSIEDVTPPDSTWYMGSLCLELSTGKIYGLTSEGDWVEQYAEEDT